MFQPTNLPSNECWHMHRRYRVAGEINPCIFGEEREPCKRLLWLLVIPSGFPLMMTGWLTNTKTSKVKSHSTGEKNNDDKGQLKKTSFSAQKYIGCRNGKRRIRLPVISKRCDERSPSIILSSLSEHMSLSIRSKIAPHPI